MKRIHLFEFMDLSWYPDTFRQIQTDYLQFAAGLGSGHQNLLPLFLRALQHSETMEILDLCSGGSGPWLHLQKQLEQAGLPVRISLSDKYPNPRIIQKWPDNLERRIVYLEEPVDALKVPPHLKGMRTLFEGFHHFKPEQAGSILQDAAEKRTAIGIFEASLKPPFGFIILMLAPLMTLLAYFFLTPFIKPTSLSRLVWTYLIPVVPLATCWDGIISLLRVYSVNELHDLTDFIESEDYTWEIGLASTGTPLFEFTYCVGYPVWKKVDGDY